MLWSECWLPRYFKEVYTKQYSDYLCHVSFLRCECTTHCNKPLLTKWGTSILPFVGSAAHSKVFGWLQPQQFLPGVETNEGCFMLPAQKPRDGYLKMGAPIRRLEGHIKGMQIITCISKCRGISLGAVVSVTRTI